MPLTKKATDKMKHIQDSLTSEELHAVYYTIGCAVGFHLGNDSENTEELRDILRHLNPEQISFMETMIGKLSVEALYLSLDEMDKCKTLTSTFNTKE